MSGTAFFVVLALLGVGAIVFAILRFNHFLVALGVGVIIFMLTFGLRSILEGDIGVWTYKAVQMIVFGGLPIFWGYRRIRHAKKA